MAEGNISVTLDQDIVVGPINTQMRGRPAECYTAVREFGAVGNGLSYALGVAAARRQGRDGKIVLFEGDGGFLFHIQELETLKRQGYRILICAMNDDGYGSEFRIRDTKALCDEIEPLSRPHSPTVRPRESRDPALGSRFRGNERSVGRFNLTPSSTSDAA